MLGIANEIVSFSTNRETSLHISQAYTVSGVLLFVGHLHWLFESTAMVKSRKIKASRSNGYREIDGSTPLGEKVLAIGRILQARN